MSGLHTLAKRQTLGADSTSQVQGLLTLAQQVLQDAQSGNLTQACQSWAGSLTSCESSAGSSQVQLAVCACQSNVISQLNDCASAYGSTGTNAASGTLRNDGSTSCKSEWLTIARDG